MSDLSNSLADLAEQVREAGEASSAAERTSVEHAFRAGLLLCQAKEACEHGEWGVFLNRAGVHERQARRWMQIARSGLQIGHVSDLGGVRAALEYIAKLTLPEPGDILFVSHVDSAEEGRELVCAWIEPVAEQPECYSVTAVLSPEQVLVTKKHPSGETVLGPDGYLNGVWLCLNEMLPIPPSEQDFTVMPAECLSKDTFEFLGDLDEPIDLDAVSIARTQMPDSYNHAKATLEACLADYSLDRAKAAWRALRALNTKMEDWPSAPKMIPIFSRIADDKEISRLEDRVRALVHEHNPELFEVAS